MPKITGLVNGRSWTQTFVRPTLGPRREVYPKMDSPQWHLPEVEAPDARFTAV